MKRIGFAMLLMMLSLIFTSISDAVELKMKGEFIIGGLYLDRITVKKNTADEGPSTAFYYQRLRVQTDITVLPGLKLITRFDAMERAWGATRSIPGNALDTASSGTKAENENIAFDWAYIDYTSPVGVFRVGYMNDNAWGTVFGDGGTPKGKIAWGYTYGPWYMTLQIVKMLNDNSYSAKNTTVTASDVDNDKYVAAVKYSWMGGETGVLGAVGRDATNRPTGDNKALFYALMPYAVAQIGPVKLQIEIDYFWGKWQEFESNTADMRMDVVAAWVDATADFDKYYIGGSIAYVSGDDPGTTDKLESNTTLINGGRDWNPCLILFNFDRTYWAGNVVGHDSSVNGGPMTNVWFFQVRAGARPFEKLDLMASVSYANADKKPSAVWLYNDYGYEIDLTATYKITNNLSYMMGAGYLFTGKYYKGTSEIKSVTNDYLVMNKITLTF